MLIACALLSGYNAGAQSPQPPDDQEPYAVESAAGPVFAVLARFPENCPAVPLRGDDAARRAAQRLLYARDVSDREKCERFPQLSDEFRRETALAIETVATDFPRLRQEQPFLGFAPAVRDVFAAFLRDHPSGLSETHAGLLATERNLEARVAALASEEIQRTLTIGPLTEAAVTTQMAAGADPAATLRVVRAWKSTSGFERMEASIADALVAHDVLQRYVLDFELSLAGRLLASPRFQALDVKVQRAILFGASRSLTADRERPSMAADSGRPLAQDVIARSWTEAPSHEMSTAAVADWDVSRLAQQHVDEAVAVVFGSGTGLRDFVVIPNREDQVTRARYLGRLFGMNEFLALTDTEKSLFINLAALPGLHEVSASDSRDALLMIVGSSGYRRLTAAERSKLLDRLGAIHVFASAFPLKSGMEPVTRALVDVVDTAFMASLAESRRILPTGAADAQAEFLREHLLNHPLKLRNESFNGSVFRSGWLPSIEEEPVHVRVLDARFEYADTNGRPVDGIRFEMRFDDGQTVLIHAPRYASPRVARLFELTGAVRRLPRDLRAGISVLEILPQPAPGSEPGRQTMMQSLTGRGTIQVFEHDGEVSTEQTILHEAGHLLTLAAGRSRLSTRDRRDYARAVASDVGTLTRYAEEGGLDEDMAEALAVYVMVPRSPDARTQRLARSVYAGRFAVIDDLLAGRHRLLSREDLRPLIRIAAPAMFTLWFAFFMRADIAILAVGVASLTFSAGRLVDEFGRGLATLGESLTAFGAAGHGWIVGIFIGIGLRLLFGMGERGIERLGIAGMLFFAVIELQTYRRTGQNLVLIGAGLALCVGALLVSAVRLRQLQKETPPAQPDAATL